MLEENENWTLRDGTLFLKERCQYFNPLEFPKALQSEVKKVVSSRELREIESPFLVFKNIEEIDLSASVRLRTIVESCFATLFHLKVVKLPKFLDIIEKRAFEDSFLEKLTINCVRLRIKSNCFPRSKIQEVEINCIDELMLDSCAFKDAPLLRKVSITTDYLAMGDTCFRNCKNLRDVTFNCRLKTLETEVFRDCEELKRIELPEGLRWVGLRTFSDCKALEYIKFPESLERISASTTFNGVSDDAVVEFLGVKWPLSLFKSLVKGHIQSNSGKEDEARKLIKQLMFGDQFYLKELQEQQETLGDYIRNCYPEEFVVKDGLPKEEDFPETSLF